MDDAVYRAIVDRLDEGVYAVDLDGRIIVWNAAAERLTGYSAADVLNKVFSHDIGLHLTQEGMHPDGFLLPAVLVDGAARQARVYVRHKDGHRIPVQVRASALRDANGAISGAVEFLTAVPAADHSAPPDEGDRDPLTELGNRRYVHRHLEPIITAAPDGIGVLFIDVDHFKSVNDTHGHAVGDQVLRAVGQTLAHGLRQSDWVARWGGEEFLAIVHADRVEELEEVAERLRTLVASSWVEAGDAAVSVTVSIGATMVAPQQPLDEAVDRADHLMYASKQAGRNRVTADRTRVIDLTSSNP